MKYSLVDKNICENCSEVHLKGKRGVGLELIAHHEFLLCSCIIKGSHKHKGSFMERPEELQQVRNIWEWTSDEPWAVVYSCLLLPNHMYQMWNIYYTLESGLYYLLPMYQRSLCPRALLSPLEQRNISLKTFPHCTLPQAKWAVSLGMWKC